MGLSTIDGKHQEKMIDRIREDIQNRLGELQTEADKLRQALSALGGRGGSSSTSGSGRGRGRGRGGRRSASTASATSTPASSGSRRGTRSRSTSRSSSRGAGAATATRSRAASGGTRNAVLKALSDANGNALTAGEVASATGLGRASVSTTLSKLAKSGEVTKAQRGYSVKS
jgi:DNA-binding transcriptional ArsR family regulator